MNYKKCQLNESTKIFVYGTLKPGESNYQSYCAGKVMEAKRGITLGQLYALPFGYPAMTIGNSPDTLLDGALLTQVSSQVNGFLLSFPNSAVLNLLDSLEDYDAQRPSAENEYNRQLIEVYDLHLIFLDLAWVYLMTPQQIHACNGVFLPSGWWSGCNLSPQQYTYLEQPR